MVWIGNRLRRLGGVKSPENEAPAAPGCVPADESPPLLMLLPDAVGIASYQCLTFPDAEAATSFMDNRFRGQIEDGMIAFWALTRDPNMRWRRAAAELLLVIRDAGRPGVVYPFSFTDSGSAYDFIRKEMADGLELWQVALYWAVKANVSVDSWGKSSLLPAAPPASAKITVTGAEAAATPAQNAVDHHLPLPDAWQSARRRAIGGPTRILRRDDEFPAHDAGANETPETNGTGGRQLPPEEADLTEGVTPIAPRNGHHPPEVGDPSTDAQEAVTRAIEEALQIVRGERKRRGLRPGLLEDKASAGVGETDVSDGPPRAADGAEHDGPPDLPAPDDDLDEGPLHEMIDEIERFRRHQRWEDQRGPFKGFGSPPGKF